MTVPTFNSGFSDTAGNRTLGTLRTDLATRLGFGAQTANLPPGMQPLLNSFLIEAQELLFFRYEVLRTEMQFSWPLTAAERFYDLTANAETSPRRVDPRKITWVGTVRGGMWLPLTQGIAPELYTMNSTGYPLRYEINQGLEVWPAPAATDGSSLVVKGHFGLGAFVADTDPTTIDDRLVFLQALANGKAHYRRPDAGNYVQQMEVMLDTLVAGSHQGRRYVPGRSTRSDYIYTQPSPTSAFP